MSFGEILKKVRIDNNLTQEELAKKINTSRSNIANYENNKNKPSIEILEQISSVLNCSIDFLLGKSGVRNPEDNNQGQIPEIRQIERGAKKMTQKDREKMVNMVMAAFEEAFNEDSEDK